MAFRGITKQPKNPTIIRLARQIQAMGVQKVSGKYFGLGDADDFFSIRLAVQVRQMTCKTLVKDAYLSRLRNAIGPHMLTRAEY